MKRVPLAIAATIAFYFLWWKLGHGLGFIKQVEVPQEPAEQVELLDQVQPQSTPTETSDPIQEPAEAPTIPEPDRQTVHIKNDVMTVSFDSLGGVVSKVVLHDFSETTKGTELITLVNGPDAKPGSTYIENFDTALRPFHLEKLGSKGIRFWRETAQGRLEKTFTLGESYTISTEIKGPETSQITMVVGQGLQQIGPNDYTKVSFLRGGTVPPKMTGLVWSADGDESRKEAPKIKSELPTNQLEEPELVDWLGVSDTYFANVFLPDQEVYNFQTWRTVRVGGKEGKELNHPGIQLSGTGKISGTFFFGPKDEALVESIDPKLKNLIDYGFAGYLSKLFHHFLMFFHGWIGNWGWAIIVLTFCIRLAMMPLTLPSIRSSIRMKEIQPKIDELKKKFSGDDLETKQKLTQETFKLYKKEGVNPFSSCLIMLPQMPIFIAYFSLLRTAIDLRHSPWALWINDLSVHDPTFIMPILMGATMFLTQMATPMPSADPAQQKMMKLMPVFITFICMWMPAGLILYMITSNLFQMAQTAIMRRKTK